MSILIDKDLIGLWYVLTGEKDDFLFAIRKHAEGLELVYRHRYYHSADPWDDQDEKTWQRFITSDRDEQKAIATGREMIAGVVRIAVMSGRLKKLPPKIHELLMGDKTVDEFFALFKELPFVHTKMVQ